MADSNSDKIYAVVEDCVGGTCCHATISLHSSYNSAAQAIAKRKKSGAGRNMVYEIREFTVEE